MGLTEALHPTAATGPFGLTCKVGVWPRRVSASVSGPPGRRATLRGTEDGDGRFRC